MCKLCGDERVHIADLPYFERRDGLIALRRPLGPIIDIHTHLAQSFVRRLQFDLHSAGGAPQHYLPAHDPVQLDVYANINLGAERVAELTHDLTVRGMTAGGMRRSHTIPNLTAEMAALGVVRSVVLPIDLPLISHNATTWLQATAGTESLICFGSVHPWVPGMRRRLEAQIALGAKGIKVHPAMQLLAPDHPRMMALFAMAGELGLPVLLHCGPVGIGPRAGDARCQVHRYEAALADNPGTRFILGHAGALQVDAAIALSRKYDNAWLGLACQGLSGMQRIFNLAPPERILFGSDWPFYHQALPLAKVLLATEDRLALRAQVLHDNAAALLGLRPAAALREAS